MKTSAQRTPLIFSLIAASAFTVCAFTIDGIKPPVKTPSPVVFLPEDTLKSFPTVMVEDARHNSVPLGMDGLKVDIQVVGNIAVTTLDMVFFNEEDRVLEGELYFPLAAGQTVSRFAMEVDGKLREGVVAEKKEARVAYENTVRRKIDPGLIEWTKGNNFKARIYPIPAHGIKRIIVAYTQELQELDGHLQYYMPMKFKDRLSSMDVRVEVLNRNQQPVLQENDLHCFRFDKLNGNYVGELHRKKVFANEPLSFAIPFPAQQQTLFERGTDQVLYFYTTVHPKKGERVKPLPKSLSLVWDVSGSAKGRNLEKELDLLRSYIARIGNMTVELVTFSNEIHSKATIPIVNGDCYELIDKLRNLQYDGATQLGCIDLQQLTGEEIILSSDCLGNFGTADLSTTRSKPVFVWNSNVVADHSNAQYLSDKTRGQYIDLTVLTQEQALDKLTLQQLRFLGVTDHPDIAVTTDRANSFTENFSIAGTTKNPDAQVLLQFGYDNEVTETIAIDLNASMLADYAGLTEKIWAQKRIAELDLRYETYMNEITQLGKKYSIVTRNTSLLILDQLEDYVTYRILPPADMRKDYFERIAGLEKEKTDAAKEHLETVVTAFKERKTWWNTKFTPPPPVKKQFKGVTSHNFGDAMGVSSGSDAMVSEAAPAMEPQADMQVSEESGTYANSTGAIHSNANTYSFNATTPLSTQQREQEAIGEKAKGEIELENWDPKTPYIAQLKKTEKGQWYKTYLDLKKDYEKQPSFFIDVADFFIKNNEKKTALRILSNIAELELENPQLLRILGHRLEQLGYYELSVSVFREVKTLRPEEPQSYRDLGLVYALIHEDQLAVNELYYVVSHSWNERFADVESLVAVEMNNVIAHAVKPLDLSAIDPRLVAAMPVDMRVIINWDTDNCDIDLWVTDPRGEKCFYSNKLTAIGGRFANDFTQGYGPEEFIIKKAIPGNYTIEANYFGNHAQSITGATTIQVQMITNYGRKSQKTKAVTRRLESEKETVKLATFTFKPQ